MVNVFVPAIEDTRTDIIMTAARYARHNMNIELTSYPIDTRTADAIESSDVSRDIVRNLMINGYRQDSVQIFMLNKDIRTEDLSWCFGATHGKIILISDYRIWNTDYSDEMKTSMLTYLLEHEVGHAYHAADDIRAQGIYDLHCTDPRCAMQQVPSLKVLAEKAKYNITCREPHEAECYCPHCRQRFAMYSR